MARQNIFSPDALDEQFRQLSESSRLGRWEKVRFERALSWLRRGENEDHDVRFILLWVALDAMFGREANVLPQGADSAPEESARGRIPNAVAAMLGEDAEGIIWRECHEKRKTIARILRNPYIYNPMWQAIAEGRAESADIQKRAGDSNVAESRARFARENGHALSLLKKGDAGSRRKFARIVFNRLGTLRNQLMHGASAHSEGLNRSQVEDGHRLLSALVPRILHVMMKSPHKRRGIVAYPPFGEKDALFDKEFDEKAFDRYFKRTMGR